MEKHSSGLSLEGEYPLALKPISQFPGTNALQQVDQDNEKFLKTSAIWHDPVDVEELDGIGLELRRQDMKISLLMEMVSELLIQQSHLPPPVHIHLTATDLQCDYPGDYLSDYPDVQFTHGTKLELKLYVMPAFPKALKLYGEVGPEREPGKLSIHFTGISPSVQDRIEKVIFTQHRRSIAQRLGS